MDVKQQDKLARYFKNATTFPEVNKWYKQVERRGDFAGIRFGEMDVT
jgi:hypothetical protein